MAIDSKEKRHAAASVGRYWKRSPLPQATPDEQWRASAGNSYGGNALSPPVAGGTAPSLMLTGMGI